MFCYKCGHELNAGDVFCVQCGAKTDGSKPDIEEKNPEQISRSIGKRRIAIIVAGCLAALGIVGGILISHNDNVSTKMESSEKQEVLSKKEFLNEISPNINMLNECITEGFGVEVDDATDYYALFASEEDMYNRDKIAKLVEDSEALWEENAFEVLGPGYNRHSGPD